MTVIKLPSEKWLCECYPFEKAVRLNIQAVGDSFAASKPNKKMGG